MRDRDYDYRGGSERGRQAYGREGGYGREPGYGRGGYEGERGWEREEFMLQRRGYGAGGRPGWAGEGYGAAGYEGRDARRWQSAERGDYERPGDVYGYGDRYERGSYDRDDFEPGRGERMYRPALMETSSHSDTEYDPRARGPMGRGGYWGQGGVGGEDVGGYGRETSWGGTPGRVTARDWDAGRESYGGRTQYDPESSARGSRFQRGSIRGESGDDVTGYGRGADFYREGGLTREGRQIAARQTGPFAGRGPRGYQRSDDRIREEVCEVLSYHGGVDASDVEVQVQNGEVTLTGTVEDRWQKRTLEDALDSIPGVKDVHNQVRVQRREWQESGWSENDLNRTGQTTTGATTHAATGATQAAAGATGAATGLGGEAERAGSNARNAARTR